MATPRSLLRRYFSGLTEQTFLGTLGVGDTALIDYLSEMLCRFTRMDMLYCLRSADGRQLEEVADMILAAEGLPPEGRTRREIHRHVGDFTLFWTGLYPDLLQKLKSRARRDFFIDYCAQGKRSYLIASGFGAEPYREQAQVLRRLSEEFELCAYGLNQVRTELDRSAGDDKGLALLFD
jgi:hypothetical protein